MIHFFLFFLLGFLPFLSFCNKKQCRHTRIEQFLTKQHLYHFRTAQFLILGLHILYHDNTHRHVTTITQVVIRTEDCTGAKFYCLKTLNFTVPAITLNQHTHTLLFHTHCPFWQQLVHLHQKENTTVSLQLFTISILFSSKGHITSNF